MYHHQIQTFGLYEQHTIYAPSSKHRLCCLPGRGGVLLDLQASGHSLLDTYQTPEEAQQHDWYKNELLFPFPNRLADGCYTWQGITYQFPINETTTQTALHGCANRFFFSSIDVHCNTDGAGGPLPIRKRWTDCRLSFRFRLVVTYRLSDINGFELEVLVENKDIQSIPIAFGWHPLL